MTARLRSRILTENPGGVNPGYPVEWNVKSKDFFVIYLKHNAAFEDQNTLAKNSSLSISYYSIAYRNF